MSKEFISIQDEMRKLEGSKDSSVVENSSEGSISKGEERYQAISSAISGAGKKLSGWFTRGKELFRAGAVGALNTPDNISAGVKFAGEKVEAGAEFVGSKVIEVSDWVEGAAQSVYKFGSERYNNAKNFVGTKAEQAGAYAKDKILLAEAVASLAVDKTKEGVGVAKDAASKTFNAAVEYSKRAVDSASLRSQQAKEIFNFKKNSFMEAILSRKAEIQAERLQKTLVKLDQLRQVARLESSLVV